MHNRPPHRPLQQQRVEHLLHQPPTPTKQPNQSFKNTQLNASRNSTSWPKSSWNWIYAAKNFANTTNNLNQQKATQILPQPISHARIQLHPMLLCSSRRFTSSNSSSSDHQLLLQWSVFRAARYSSKSMLGIHASAVHRLVLTIVLLYSAFYCVVIMYKQQVSKIN